MEATTVNIQLSDEFFGLAKKTARAELLASDKLKDNPTLTKYYERCMEQAYADGVPRYEVSKTVLHELDNQMFELQKRKDPTITREESRINRRQYYKVSSRLDFRDPAQVRTGELAHQNNSSYISEEEVDQPTSEGYFMVLTKYLEIARNNVTNLENLIEKLTHDPATIARQKQDSVSAAIADRKADDLKLVTKRRTFVKKYVTEKITKGVKKYDAFLKKLDKIISVQERTYDMWDDRVKLTAYQQMMAQVCIDGGYDMGDIARLLHVTSKHVKLNIYADRKPGDKLAMLEYFDRCPNPDCGIKLSEFLPVTIKAMKRGRLISVDKYDPEPLVETGYQKENLRLQRELLNLRHKLGAKK